MGEHQLEQLVDFLRDFFLDWRSWAYICAAGFLLGVAGSIRDEFSWRRQRRELQRREQHQRELDERKQREWRSRIHQQWRDDHRERAGDRDESPGPIMDTGGPGNRRDRF
jgi:hypothetical protein